MRSIEELVAGIESRREHFDATAGQAEALGTAPAALVELMAELRVPMVKVPAEVGGDQLGMADQLRYFEALAAANPTAGWTGFNHAGAAGMTAARLDEAGLEEVFSGDRPPFLAAVSAPSGTYVPTDGGILMSGTYRYASGVPHADWILLAAIERSEQPSVRLGLVSAADATIAGSWEVMALQGTGSLDVEVDGAFVPDHLTSDPLTDPVRGGPLYRLGYQAYVSGENLGFTIGVCQRFIDELTRYATTKTRGPDGRLADRPAFHYELGKGQLQVDAARAHGLQVLGEADAVLGTGAELTATQEESVVAMLAHATESAANAISHLFHFAGAGALFSDNILQRLYRDANGSVQHHVASNVVYDRVGARMLAVAGDE